MSCLRRRIVFSIVQRKQPPTIAELARALHDVQRCALEQTIDELLIAGRIKQHGDRFITPDWFFLKSEKEF